jgi:molecular chaperone GrpE (heat shock protein)
MGLAELELVDTEYDPHTAEAVDMIEDEGKENIIKEIVKRGYKVGDRIVRVAQVKVTKKKHE